jgi:hypothetical protein
VRYCSSDRDEVPELVVINVTKRRTGPALDHSTIGDVPKTFQGRVRSFKPSHFATLTHW